MSNFAVASGIYHNTSVRDWISFTKNFYRSYIKKQIANKKKFAEVKIHRRGFFCKSDISSVIIRAPFTSCFWGFSEYFLKRFLTLPSKKTSECNLHKFDGFCHVTAIKLRSVTDNLLGVSQRFSVWAADNDASVCSYKIHLLLSLCKSKN